MPVRRAKRVVSREYLFMTMGHVVVQQKYSSNTMSRRSFASFGGASRPSLLRTPSQALYKTLSEEPEDPGSRSPSSKLKEDIEQRDEAAKTFSPFSVMKDVARGMRYLHSKDGGRQAHRDLKSLNILLNSEWEVSARSSEERSDELTRAHAFGNTTYTATPFSRRCRLFVANPVQTSQTFPPSLLALLAAEQDRGLRRVRECGWGGGNVGLGGDWHSRLGGSRGPQP